MSATTREEIRIGQLAIRFLVEGETSGGAVAVFEFDVPAGARLPIAHSHDGYEETIYGLNGVLTWTVEGTATDVGPGEAICIRRGAVHRFDNNGDVDASALGIATPGVIAAGYSESSPRSCRPLPAALPDPAERLAVMRRHGIAPAP